MSLMKSETSTFRDVSSYWRTGQSMNYFYFHIGDYISATQHLSLEEDLMYRRLLDLCYVTEKALPKDYLQLFRMTRANSDCTQEAVRSVISEFFLSTDSGWINKRAESELNIMRDKRTSKDEREQHEKDRMRRHREKRSMMFAALRTVNVVPAWDIPITQLEVLYRDKCDSNVLDLQRVQVQPATHLQRVQNDSATAIPTPTPTPIKNTSTNTDKSYPQDEKPELRAEAPPDGVLLSVWEDFRKHRKDKKARLTPTALAGIQREANKAGWSLNDALAECCSRGWTGFKSDWVAAKTKPLDVVRQTVPGTDVMDPALAKTYADEKVTKPMPQNIRDQIAFVTRVGRSVSQKGAQT